MWLVVIVFITRRARIWSLLCILGWLENGGFGIVWLGLGFGSTSV